MTAHPATLAFIKIAIALAVWPQSLYGRGRPQLIEGYSMALAYSLPGSPVIRARLQAMRGQRGFVGDGLHALGVRLGLRFGGSFYYPSEDRTILQCRIIPHYQLSDAHTSILFVGSDWYTEGYNRMFEHKNYTTIDADPARARYGARQHIVDSVTHLDRHVAPGSLDAIFFNGIIGWGLDTIADADAAFAACHRGLRPGGDLMIGWNDLAAHRPFKLDEVASLAPFERPLFPPLGTREYRVDNEWRHVFSFFRK